MTIGETIGPYRVLAKLGEGGMGKVYRARDTRLQRDVAVKVLPDSFASDPERLARFTREAQTLASLNHPNIAHIHGLEESGGVRALVMELVEGEDLSQRIARGAMPIDEALPIARQIAEALEAAHEQGIIHRDLKPANIKVTDDGTVKVLDFGLAKAFAPEGTPVSGTRVNAPTITSPALTQMGVILGTAAYMSPEQARGKAVDTRADIWAFGCVLFEMLTGRRAFEAEDISLTLAEVMKSEPAWGLLPALPPLVETFLRQCLEKAPKQRVHSIGDVRLALEGAFKTTVAPPAARATPPRRKTRAFVAAAMLAVAGAAGAGVALWTAAPPALPAGRFTVLRPEKTTLGYYEAFGRPALSPDGRTIAFTAVASTGVRQIWLRPLDALVSKPLAGTEGASFPFWSPDSRQLGFFANGKLKKIESQGGTPLTLCDAVGPRGGSWSAEGVILFGLSSREPLYRVSAGGGAPSPATALDPEHGVASHRFPWFLPDGRHFLFMATAGDSAAQPVGGVQLGSLDAKDARTLVPAGTNEEPLSSAVYAQGHLLFSRQNTLLAQPFDEASLKTTGDIAPVVEQVASIPTVGEGAFSVSSDGLLVFLAGGDSSRHRLAWVNRAGKQMETLGDPGSGNSSPVAISRDGQYVAASFQADPRGNRDIRIYDLRTNLGRTIVSKSSNDEFPTWSPDGKTIAYRSTGAEGLYGTATDEAAMEETLYSDPSLKFPTAWSPDGRFLLFSARVGAVHDILALPMTGERTPWPVIQTPADEADARFAPDGRWLVYTSNQSGRTEVYAAAFTGAPGTHASRPRQVSVDGGTFPRWRGDGREILYLTPGRMLMSADARLGNDSLDVGTPRPLFGPLSYTAYDVAPDGQRFLVRLPVGDSVDQPLTIIQNWTATLRR